MIPLMMKLKVHKNGRRFGLVFPVIIIWVLLLSLMIVLFPLALIAALITWRRGPGKALLLIYPLLFSVLIYLSGLHIEVGDPRNRILISFS